MNGSTMIFKNLRYLKKKENKNTIAKNLWDAKKAVLREKFIPIQVNNLNLYFKKLEIEQQIKPKVRRKKLIKTIVKINKIVL